LSGPHDFSWSHNPAINGRDSLIARLNRVLGISHAFGYGVGDDMDYLLARYAKRRTSEA
jgi:hypothetical protein